MSFRVLFGGNCSNFFWCFFSGVCSVFFFPRVLSSSVCGGRGFLGS